MRVSVEIASPKSLKLTPFMRGFLEDVAGAGVGLEVRRGMGTDREV